MRKILIATLMLFLTSPIGQAAPCGGSFDTWLNDVKTQARKMGFPQKAVKQFFLHAQHDPRTLKADQAQNIFKLDFTTFAGRVISEYRLIHGARHMKTYAKTLKIAEQKYNISPSILVAFWGLETDFGLNQGNFNTLNSLLTLAHDCRRPELFRPQIFAALNLYTRGGFDPTKTQGGWAGEIGMVQMLPDDLLNYGVDGDGDGVVLISKSAEDALLSGAKMLSDFGWRADEPWMQEVNVPTNMDWSLSNLETLLPVEEWQRLGVEIHTDAFKRRLKAALYLPHGHKGPAFLLYPNFFTLLEWNKSLNYVSSAAHFAARLAGHPPFDHKAPEAGLSIKEMIILQRKLTRAGFDVGKIDGILGRMTRKAVQAEQIRLGYPADAWPTPAFFAAY